MSTLSEVQADQAGKADPTFTRSKGGTAEREEIISQIQVPDLWFLIQDMKQGTTISKKEGQRLVAAIEETWQLCHDLKRHAQSNG